MKITIGENVKALRVKKGITQEQLADVLGVTCAAVSKWERGETYPDITLIFPIAYYFGVSVDELMGYNRDKVEQDIKRIVDEFLHAYWQERDWEKAKKIIDDGYREYPDDYEIMSRYMWTLGVSDAEPDLDAALAHRDELEKICGKIIGGCTDGQIRLSAWKMKAILLHAEGKTEEARKVHEEKCGSWWTAFEQMNEQMFKKDTPEFLYWARRNMYELASFAADKISKSIFFDASIPGEKRIADIEACGDALTDAYVKTGNSVFIEMARSLYGRLSNDIKYRDIGTEEDEARVREKYAAANSIVNANCDKDKALYDSIYGNQ